MDALACKAVALLQLQEYSDADKVLQHKALQGQMPLERVRWGTGGRGCAACKAVAELTPD